MSKPGLLSVTEALKRIVACAPSSLATETLPLRQCCGRYLAEDLTASRAQPPFRASAMDGYALRSDAVGPLPQTFRVIGESAAGKRFDGKIGANEAVRIFTGAPVPDDADTVVMQEDTDASGSDVIIREFHPGKPHIRDAGVDFTAGRVLLQAGQRLDARRLGLAAAAGIASLKVCKKPRLALLATGDELALPGMACTDDQIYSSNSFSIHALAEEVGAEVIDLGIAEDNFEALERAIVRAKEARADIIVTMGGVSVGDRDLVQPALTRQGMTTDFWKVAVRPGKPLLFGKLDETLIFGLPGNPVSAFITGLLFVLPAIRSLCGVKNAAELPMESCLLGASLPVNGDRQDHLRATLGFNEHGLLTATPCQSQDSSLLSVLSQADALIVRLPLEAAAAHGDLCRILRF